MTKKVWALCALLMVPSLGFAAYENVAIVAKSGGDYRHPLEAMNARATWCPSPSATNPCLVKIMPGVYDLAEVSPQYLLMQAYVDVEGAGPSLTTLKRAGTGPVVLFAQGLAELRSLTLENFDPATSGTWPLGAQIQKAARLRDVVINVSGGWGGVGVSATGSSGLPVDVVLERVTVAATGTSQSCAAVQVGNVNMTIRDSALSASCSATTVTGVLADGWVQAGTTIDIADSTIAANGGRQMTTGIFARSARDVNVKGSRISAAAASLHARAIMAGESYGTYGTVRVDGSSLAASSPSGTTAWIFALDANPTLLIGASRLTGPVATGTAWHFTCAASYNGSYVPLNAQCQPVP